MKKISLFGLGILFAFVLPPSANAQFDQELHQVAKERIVQQANNDADEETTSQPCWIADNDEYFAASGYFRIKYKLLKIRMFYDFSQKPAINLLVL